MEIDENYKNDKNEIFQKPVYGKDISPLNRLKLSLVNHWETWLNQSFSVLIPSYCRTVALGE